MSPTFSVRGVVPAFFLQKLQTAGVDKTQSLGSGVVQTRPFAVWGKVEFEQKSAAVTRCLESFRAN